MAGVFGLESLVMLAVALLMLGRMRLEAIHHLDVAIGVGAIEAGIVAGAMSLREHTGIIAAKMPLQGRFRGGLAQRVAEEGRIGVFGGEVGELGEMGEVVVGGGVFQVSLTICHLLGINGKMVLAVSNETARDCAASPAGVKEGQGYRSKSGHGVSWLLLSASGRSGRRKVMDCVLGRLQLPIGELTCW